jgi:hypothetical protein
MRLILVSLLAQFLFGQIEYFTKCTLGQIPLKVDGENYCHEEHFLKGKLANNAAREQWRNLRINVFCHLIFDAINRKSVGTCVLIIGDIKKKPSIFIEALLKWATFDLQIIFSCHFCSVIH